MVFVGKYWSIVMLSVFKSVDIDINALSAVTDKSRVLTSADVELLYILIVPVEPKYTSSSKTRLNVGFRTTLVALFVGL